MQCPDLPFGTDNSFDEEALFKPISEFFQQDLQSHEANDPREVSIWLRTTKWHLHTEPYDSKSLCDLVAFPKDNDKLVKSVRSYFQVALETLQSIDELTLQYLNTNDPVK